MNWVRMFNSAQKFSIRCLKFFFDFGIGGSEGEKDWGRGICMFSSRISREVTRVKQRPFDVGCREIFYPVGIGMVLRALTQQKRGRLLFCARLRHCKAWI